MLYELTMKCEVKTNDQPSRTFVGLFPTRKEAEETGDYRIKDFPAYYWGYEIEEIPNA